MVFDMNEARMICDFIERAGDIELAQGPLRPGRLAGVRFRARSEPRRRGQSDHDAVGRVARHRGGSAAEHRPALWRSMRWRSTSAPSTRSARPPRNGRMRSWRCFRSRSIVMIVVGGYNSQQHVSSCGTGTPARRPHLSHRGRRRHRRFHRNDSPPADRHQGGSQ